MAQPLPPQLSPAIAAQLAHLRSSRVAVRSSALQEDTFFSFAGQFETVLNMPRDQVGERYKEVVASQFTPRALYYCHSSGFSYQELAMGVLVMEMVPVRCAGVLYTDDPRGGESAYQCRLRAGLPGGGRSGGTRHLRIEAGRIVAQHIAGPPHARCRPEGGVLDVPTPGRPPGTLSGEGSGPGPGRPGKRSRPGPARI